MIFAIAQRVLADISQIVIGIVALLFLVIRQLLEANKQAGPQRARPPLGAPPQPQPPGKGAAPAAGQQADPLRAQVEEFLRRAGRPPQAGQARPPQRPPQPASAGEIKVLVDPPRADAPRTLGQPLRQAEWRNPAAQSPAAAPQPASGAGKRRSPRGSAKPRRRQSVAEHVAEQVTTHARSLGDTASQMGQRIAEEDQQFDNQLKAKFDHSVGTLAESAAPASAEETPPPSDTPAAQLASLLANPIGIRQAVLVNEILRRPSERW